MKSTSSEKGQTLIEVIVVVTIGVLVIGALVFATIASLRNSQFAKNQALATQLAQEGIEWVRTGRDRNEPIFANLLPYNNSPSLSWINNSSDSACTDSSSIWCYQISASCQDSIVNSGGATITNECYFKAVSNGTLTAIGPSPTFPVNAEMISTPPGFKRVITMSDSGALCPPPNGVPCYQVEKTVTVIVTWTDFAGSHQSELTTILSKI